jgi:hypothetical protein
MVCTSGALREKISTHSLVEILSDDWMNRFHNFEYWFIVTQYHVWLHSQQLSNAYFYSFWNKLHYEQHWPPWGFPRLFLLITITWNDLITDQQIPMIPDSFFQELLLVVASLAISPTLSNLQAITWLRIEDFFVISLVRCQRLSNQTCIVVLN